VYIIPNKQSNTPELFGLETCEMALDDPQNSGSTLAGHAEVTSRDSASSAGSSLPASPNSQQSFASIRSINPDLKRSNTKTDLADESTARTISQRKSYTSGHEGEEWAQIEKLISRMFGEERKSNSEEEKTRHVGVVWKDLTVKGVGLGAALQPTNGDIFLGLPRLIKRLFTRGRKGTGVGKPAIRTILDDFTVSINTRCNANTF
jgi:hypothetical protein